jgi:hypothetical protein
MRIFRTVAAMMISAKIQTYDATDEKIQGFTI